MADLGGSVASLLQVPGLQGLLNQQLTRQNQLQPLRAGIYQQAANMLPNAAFGTVQPNNRPNIGAIPAVNYAPPSSSGMSPLLAGLLGAGGGVGLTLLLQHLMGAGKGGGGGMPAGNGGSGGSFSFGNNSLGGYLKNLITGGGDKGGVPIPGGEFDPNAIYGDPNGVQYPPAQTYGPPDPYAGMTAGDSGDNSIFAD